MLVMSRQHKKLLLSNRIDASLPRPSPGKDGKPLSTESSSTTVTAESDYFITNGVVFRNDARR